MQAIRCAGTSTAHGFKARHSCSRTSHRPRPDSTMFPNLAFLLLRDRTAPFCLHIRHQPLKCLDTTSNPNQLSTFTRLLSTRNSSTFFLCPPGVLRWRTLDCLVTRAAEFSFQQHATCTKSRESRTAHHSTAVGEDVYHYSMPLERLLNTLVGGGKEGTLASCRLRYFTRQCVFLYTKFPVFPYEDIF